jgi:hypothetical protein
MTAEVWQVVDLNAAAGGGAPAADAPIAYVTYWPNQGQILRVVYPGTDYRIWELAYGGPGAP